MIFPSSDPIRDFERFDVERQSKLERLPKCTDCGEPIVSDTFYEIGIDRLCESCLNNHRRWTDEYTAE